MLIPFGVFSAAGAGGGAAAGAYELISTTLISTNTASMTLNTSGLSAYKHLEIRLTARSSITTAPDYFLVRFNSDTGTNYSAHGLDGNGTTTSSWGYVTQNNMTLVGYVPGANSVASGFSAMVASVLDFNSTTKYKTIRALAGGAAYNHISLTSGSWRNTAAITAITFSLGSGSFVSGSRLSLYGVKA